MLFQLYDREERRHIRLLMELTPLCLPLCALTEDKEPLYSNAVPARAPISDPQQPVFILIHPEPGDIWKNLRKSDNLLQEKVEVGPFLCYITPIDLKEVKF